jgi:hypothetical protein
MTVDSELTHGLGDDMTLRWSCRAGEYVLWVSASSIMGAGDASGWKIRDFWQMRDGDFVTITNRLEDLPSWFEIDPLETVSRVAFQLARRMNAGHCLNGPMDGPNIWRPKGGDRLVWVSSRARRKPVIALLDMQACALVIGDNAQGLPAPPVFIGAPEGDELKEDDARAMRAGFDAVVDIGIPRVFSVEWSLGA